MENTLAEKFDSLCAGRGYKTRPEVIRGILLDALIENELQ